MPERFRKILDRVKAWWQKFNTKQRALLISITSAVIVALVILAIVVSRPTYVQLIVCEDTKQSSEVKSLLEGDSIDYQVSDNGLVYKVKEADESKATILLGANDIQASKYTLEAATSGGFSSTESDKQKLYQAYLEDTYAKDLTNQKKIKSATVRVDLPEKDGTILSKDEQASAAVTLDLKESMDTDEAYGIAQYIATELGNKDTTRITIIDTKGNVLYSGADADSSVGIASTQLTYKKKQENMISNQVRDIFVESKLYSNVQVAVNADVEFDTTETAIHEYYAPDGQTNGMLSSASEYNSESRGGTAATPGTDSNDDTTYQIEDGSGTYSIISQTDYKYQNNEKIVKKNSNGGSINYDNSSISIVCNKSVIYDEAVLEETGELDNMSFDEFKAANSEAKQVEVSEDVVNLVATATGFKASAITIICYEQPEFIEKASSSLDFSKILMIALAVLIFLMLAYVVFRSTRAAKEADMEPELSVEGLLESTVNEDEALEDIGYSEKSETRILIEKFVEDNPEAAALLLRNWLNDEWG